VGWWNALNFELFDALVAFGLLDSWTRDHVLGYWDFSTLWSPKWVSWRWDINMGSYLQDLFFNAPLVKTLFSRVNGLNSYSDNLVKQLNTTLNNAIKSFPNNNNFLLVDTYTKFNEYPDRDQGPICYNDLVNVEFTSGYDTSKMDWGALWRDQYGDNWQAYWKNLFLKHWSFINAAPSLNMFDYLSFNIDNYVKELITDVVTKVIVPNVDPHPETAGHKVMKDIFLTKIPHK
jgi:hypothetical protein